MALKFLSPEGNSLTKVDDETCALIGMGRFTWTAEVVGYIKKLLEGDETHIFRGVTEDNIETVQALCQKDAFGYTKNPHFIGLLPIFNNIGGYVAGVHNGVNKILSRKNTFFTPGKIKWKPDHQLAFKGELSDVKTIHAHKQAWDQTLGRDFSLMKRIFGREDIKFVEEKSTEAGAHIAYKDPTVAALCTPRAVQHYNLNRHSDSLVSPENETKFQILTTTKETSKRIAHALKGDVNFLPPKGQELFLTTLEGMENIMDFFTKLREEGIMFIPINYCDSNTGFFACEVGLDVDIDILNEIAEMTRVKITKIELVLQQAS